MFKRYLRLPAVNVRLLLAGFVALAVPGLVVAAPQSSDQAASVNNDHPRTHQVVIPPEDRFTAFAITIHAGDSVQWSNTDTDDHTVVSDDALNSANPRGVNHLIPGTDSNNGQPGKFTLRFTKPGVFVYYCRFHSHLDGHNQPTAPGPDGGIQDANGNFGTPMMGVITVLAGDK